MDAVQDGEPTDSKQIPTVQLIFGKPGLQQCFAGDLFLQDMTYSCQGTKILFGLHQDTKLLLIDFKD